MDNDVSDDNTVTGSAQPVDFRGTVERERAALRAGILDAAGRLLVAEGPQALSMRRIAREVNASTTVLYTMFGGKDGLADELFREGFTRLAEAQAAAGPSADPLRRLTHRAHVYLDNAAANPSYYRVMFFDAIPGFHPSETTLAETWGTFSALAETVRACAQAGLFAAGVADDPREAALALWAAAHGVASLHIAGHLPDLPDARRVLDRMVRGVISDLLVQPAADRSGQPASPPTPA